MTGMNRSSPSLPLVTAVEIADLTAWCPVPIAVIDDATVWMETKRLSCQILADAAGRLSTSRGSLEVGEVIDEEDQRWVGSTHQTC